MSQVRARHNRAITPEAFARFLQRLDPDADRAAREYGTLRLALVKFFDWRGSWAPDECADETIDRLVVKLGEGVLVEDMRRYAYGIARLVLLEDQRRRARIPIAGEASLANVAVDPAVDADPLHACLDACLAQLPDDGRALVLAYYAAEGQTKIDNRQRLARTAGISNTALRSRVHRLRDRLERCAQRCVATTDRVGLAEALRHIAAAGDTIQQDSNDH
jgi:DNA-directed RNA polymerase specialized sigma24 family protein